MQNCQYSRSCARPFGARCEPLPAQPGHWHAGPVSRTACRSASMRGLMRMRSNIFESKFIVGYDAAFSDASSLDIAFDTQCGRNFLFDPLREAIISAQA